MYRPRMAQQPPLWLQLVHRLERAVGTQVEAAVRSDAYFDLLAQATKLRARLMRATEEATTEWLHLWNLPSSSDVRRLREQLSRVERRLAEVAKDLADREEERDGDAPPPPVPPPPTTPG
jgi:hypothetical protein